MIVLLLFKYEPSISHSSFSVFVHLRWLAYFEGDFMNPYDLTNEEQRMIEMSERDVRMAKGWGSRVFRFDKPHGIVCDEIHEKRKTG